MSIPKFNLHKLRASVASQQTVTKKDIRNLLLLDRLRAGIGKQSQKQKEVDFDYRVRVWHDNSEGYRVELISFGPISQDKSFCKYLEDEISRLKASGVNTYLQQEILDEVYGCGCDEVEDKILHQLYNLREYGEESDSFLDFKVYAIDDPYKEINISISVQRY